jgi:hypothetical protein
MKGMLSLAYGMLVFVVDGVWKMKPSARGSPFAVMTISGGFADELLKTRHGHVIPSGSVSTWTLASLGMLFLKLEGKALERAARKMILKAMIYILA